MLDRKSTISQDQLLQKVDIDPKHLDRIEVGRSYPSLDTLERLANTLKVELSVFFEFTHKARSNRELKKIISELFKDADEDKLRLVVKVLKALVR